MLLQKRRQKWKKRNQSRKWVALATKPIGGRKKEEQLPTRQLDREKVATQRYGIDVMQVEHGSETQEHGNFQSLERS